MYIRKILLILFIFFSPYQLLSKTSYLGIQFEDKESLNKIKHEVAKIDQKSVLEKIALCSKLNFIEELSLKSTIQENLSKTKNGVLIPNNDLYLFNSKVIEIHPFFGMSPGISLFLDNNVYNLKKTIKNNNIIFDECKQNKNSLTLCSKKVSKRKTIILRDGYLPRTSNPKYKNKKITVIGCLLPYRK